MTTEMRDELLANIQRRLTPQAVKIRADIELTCFSYDGIDGIIAALKAGEAASTNDDIQIKVGLFVPTSLLRNSDFLSFLSFLLSLAPSCRPSLWLLPCTS